MDARPPFSWTGSQVTPAHSRSMSAFSLPYHSLLMPLSNVRSSACDISVGGPDSFTREAQQAPSTGGPFESLYTEQCDVDDYDDIYGDMSSSSPEVELATPSQQLFTPPFMHHSASSHHSLSSNYSVVEDLIPSSAPEPPLLYLTDEYKALAECLAPWIADYLWKAIDAPHTSTLSPASTLVTGIRDILWSTMLQPSAVFLALWYLSKFPADFLPSHGEVGGIALKFRHALFCSEVLTMENACHRLFVCICMLADRELHDNCFSSATWSEISRVPSANLAELEFCSLNMLDHSLWISPQSYSDWLTALHRYHLQLSPEEFATPSGRDVYATLTRQFEHVVDTMTLQTNDGLPEPVFIFPGERLIVLEKDDVSISDIDLDIDGPLRDEYVPRRASHRRSASSHVFEPHSEVAVALGDDTSSLHSRHSSLFDLDVVVSPSFSNTFHSSSVLGHKSWTSVDYGATINHNRSSNPFSPTVFDRWSSARTDHTSSFVRPQWLRA